MSESEVKARFQHLLKKSFKIKDEITSVSVVTPQHLAGEHLASSLEIVTLTFKNEEIKPMEFFVKKLLAGDSNSEEKKALVSGMRNEAYFLTALIEKMKKFCKDRAGSDQLIAGIFPTAFEANEVSIVMENLATRGFATLNSGQKQDFFHAKLVIENLSRLHSVSYAMIDNIGSRPKFLEKHAAIYDLYEHPEGRQLLSSIAGKGFNIGLEILKNSRGVKGSKEIYEQLKPYDGLLIEELAKIVSSGSLFPVVNHGDCHNKNILFGGRAKDEAGSSSQGNHSHVVFVDMQSTRVASPCLDLSYYIFVSGDGTVRKSWKQLLEIYFDKFDSHLLDLRVQFPFSYEDVVAEFRNKCNFGMLFGVAAIVVVGAMRHFDTESLPADCSMTEAFASTMEKWIADHPEENEAIAQEIVECVHDYNEIMLDDQ